MEGSQGEDTAATAIHAMRSKGQSPENAVLKNKALINGALEIGDLGLAGHGVQDSVVHGFGEWNGSFSALGFSGAVKHLWHDIFPSRSTISKAYNRTKKAYSGRSNSGAKYNPFPINSNGTAANGSCGISCRWGQPTGPFKRDDRDQWGNRLL